MNKKNMFMLVLMLIMSFNICFATEITLSDENIFVDGVDVKKENVDGITYSNEMNNGSSEEIR